MAMALPETKFRRSFQKRIVLLQEKSSGLGRGKSSNEMGIFSLQFQGSSWAHYCLFPSNLRARTLSSDAEMRNAHSEAIETGVALRPLGPPFIAIVPELAAQSHVQQQLPSGDVDFGWVRLFSHRSQLAAAAGCCDRGEHNTSTCCCWQVEASCRRRRHEAVSHNAMKGRLIKDKRQRHDSPRGQRLRR
jgi:hypothetical protein